MAPSSDHESSNESIAVFENLSKKTKRSRSEQSQQKSNKITKKNEQSNQQPSKQSDTNMKKVKLEIPRLRWTAMMEKYLIRSYNKIRNESGEDIKGKVWTSIAYKMNKKFESTIFTEKQCKNKFSEMKSKYSKQLRFEKKVSNSGFGSTGSKQDSRIIEEINNAHPHAPNFKHFELMAEAVGEEVFTGKQYICWLL